MMRIACLVLVVIPAVLSDEYLPPPAPSYDCGYRKAGLYPDISNCAYYYVCPSGKRRPCPKGTLFDPKIGVCNHKEFVHCHSGVSCPEEKGLFAHPWDCGKYLNCYFYTPYVQSCPYGLVFNPEEGYCDYKYNDDCKKYYYY